MADLNLTTKISPKHTMQWFSFKPYTSTRNEEKKLLAQGRKDATAQKYCSSTQTYNHTHITIEEEIAFQELQVDILEKNEQIENTNTTLLSVIKTKMNQLMMDPNFSIKKLGDNYKEAFKLEETSLKEKLKEKANMIIGSRRQLMLFRVTHKLSHRDAHYPSSTLFFWGLLFLMLVAESIANAYFYAQGSDLGLLGGVLQAFLIAVANVLLSFGLGFIVLRYTHYIHTPIKIFAWIGFILGLWLLSFLHLVTAHYRELLINLPDKASSIVLKDTWQDPFNIQDIDSLILVIIGLSISILVMFKSYRYDDSYPGYGKEWRQWLEVNTYTEESIKQYKENLQVILNTVDKDITQLEANVHEGSNDLKKLLCAFDKHKKDVERYCVGTMNTAVKLSRVYREGYNQIAEQEILLSDGKIVGIISETLDLQTSLTSIQIHMQTARQQEKKYLESKENILIKKSELLEKLKKRKEQMTQDNSLDTMVNEALNEAKKERAIIGDTHV